MDSSSEESHESLPTFPQICAEPGLAWIVTMLIGGITSIALEAERWGRKEGADLSLFAAGVKCENKEWKRDRR